MERFIAFHAIFLLAVLLLSCKQGASHREPDFNEDSFGEVYKLGDGALYRNDSLGLKNPRWIRFHPDSFLVVIEMGAPFQLKIADLKTGKVQKLIPKGRGSKEMLVAWGVDIVDNEITVFDGMQKKIYVLSADSNRNFDVRKEIALQDKDIISIYPLSAERFVGLTGLRQHSRLTYFDSAGVVVDTVGDFPLLQNNDEFRGDNNIFSSYMAGSPSGTKLVLATTNTDVLEIYDTAGGLTKRFQGPKGILLRAREENMGIGTMTLTEPRFKGFSHAIGNEKEFWVGYIGSEFKKNTPSTIDQFLPKKIFCFDWDGKPLKKLEVDVPLISFAADWQREILYGLVMGEVPQVMVFDLKERRP